MKIKQAAYFYSHEKSLFSLDCEPFRGRAGAFTAPEWPAAGAARWLQEAAQGAGLAAGGQRRVELPTQQCSPWEEAR